MSDIALLHATFPDAAEASRIARLVIEERLAVCANILPGCTSIYRWHGAIEEAQEVAVLFKTTLQLAARLRARIDALHPYDLPVTESWPAAAGEAVARWVAEETG